MLLSHLVNVAEPVCGGPSNAPPHHWAHLPERTRQLAVPVTDSIPKRLPQHPMKNARRFPVLFTPVLWLTAAAGAQSFNDSALYEDSPEPVVDVEFGDINGDGILDLVSMAYTRDYILWQPGTSDGTFGAARSVRFNFGSASPSSIDLGDVDGDGDVDIVSARFGFNNTGALRIHENLGGGVFGPPRTIDSPATRFATLGDMNGDGAADILVYSGNAEIAWYRNLGSGAFAPRAPIIGVTSEIDELVAADLDGDSDQDVVFMASIAGSIFWVENLGGGSYGPRQLATSQFFNPRDLEIVDVDSDGDLDLLSLSTQGRYVAWVANDGSAQFGTRRVIEASTSASPRQNAAGDMDGDGDIDIASAWSSGKGLVWYENLGFGFFATPSTVSIGAAPPRVLELVDLDGDADLDPFLTQENHSWSQNLGAGSFAPLSPTSLLSTQGLVGFLAVDIDGDSDSDIYAARPLSDELVTLSNLGGGEFAEPVTLAANLESVSAIQAADLDGDGDLDLITGSGSFAAANASAHWHENLGSGALAAPISIYSDIADSGASVDLRDFDGDGDTDALVQHRAILSLTDVQATLVRNDLNGSFTPLQGTNLGRVSNGQALDVDGDLDLDLVTHTYAGGFQTLNWHANIGGTFGPAQPIQTFSQQFFVMTVSDVDGDGIGDIVLTGTAPPSIQWFRGTTSPGFGAPAPLVSLPVRAVRFTTLDLDADGDDELIVDAGGETNWFENLGGGAFGQPMPFSVSASLLGAGASRAADLDGDLDTDLYTDFGVGLVIHRNDERIGAGYCLPGTPNSTGEAARISAAGSTSVSINSMTLSASGMPPNQFGFFLVADAPGFVVAPGGSQGNLCLGGAIGRITRNPGEIFQSSAAGQTSVPLDLTDVPTPSNAESVMAGDTRYFQGWFRDAQSGAASNLTNGLRVTFTL